MHRILVVLLLATATALSVPAAHAECRGSGFRDYYRNGVRARDFERWGEVVDCMRAALREEERESLGRIEISGAREEHYLPYYHLGWALSELRRLEEARDALRASLEQGVSRQDRRFPALQERLRRVELAIAADQVTAAMAKRDAVGSALAAAGVAPIDDPLYQRATIDLEAARSELEQERAPRAEELAIAAVASFEKVLAELAKRPAGRHQELATEVREAAVAYAERNYGRVLALLERRTFSAPRDELNAHLLLGASLHALIRRGEAGDRSLDDVRRHVEACLAIRPGFRPPSGAYPPDFVALFTLSTR